MAVDDPVPVYDAASNEEAHLIQRALQAVGVKASISETGGIAPLVHPPQVFVRRADLERAIPVLEELERQAVSRQREAAAALPLEVACDECGAVNVFSMAQHGSVQQCRQCAAFLDVGEDAGFDDWQGARDEEAEEGEEGP